MGFWFEFVLPSPTQHGILLAGLHLHLHLSHLADALIQSDLQIGLRSLLTRGMFQLESSQ
jgi:hypothetical protein